MADYLTDAQKRAHCAGVVSVGQYVPLPDRRLAVSSDQPTYCPNRTLIPWGPLGTEGYIPRLERCATKLRRIGKPQRTWTFADGDWRGPFHAYQLEIYTEARLYWKSHLDGANIAYLDEHVEWVHSNRYVPIEDSPGAHNPQIDWCEMEYWHTMWKK